MVRYRYRTTVLRGSWRDSRDVALRDAIKAKQAVEDPDADDGVRWLVPGEIEPDGDAPIEMARYRRESRGRR